MLAVGLPPQVQCRWFSAAAEWNSRLRFRSGDRPVGVIYRSHCVYVTQSLDFFQKGDVCIGSPCGCSR